MPTPWPSCTNRSTSQQPKLGASTETHRVEVAAEMDQRLRIQNARAAPDSYDSAFVQLYQSYYTRVFAFVYSRVANVELSKDLTAEIFERAYVKGHGLREPAAYGTWIFTIARNHVAGHYRRNKREMNSMDRVKDSLWLTDRPPDPEDRAVRSEQIDRLMRHFRLLPRRDQELLSLKFDAELTYTEIARVMEMSDVNVRVSIFRALKRLRDRLKKEKAES